MDQGTNMRLMFLIVFVLAVVCTALITRTVMVSGGSSSAGMNEQAMRDAVIDAMRNDTEAVIAALNEGQQKLMQKQQEEQSKKINEMRDQIENDPKAAVVGNPEGDVTIVEFFDYKCGYCRRVAPVLQTLLKEDKNLKVVFKEFPILSDVSVRLSKASLSVHRLYPDKFFDFHLEVLKKGPDTDAQIAQIAAALGMDADKIKAEMEKQEYQEYIDKEREFGASVGIRGTPAFLINGEFNPGAMEIDTFRERIKAAREKK